uniref:Uncharacterized protein n=1 Tax=Hucho hucho TaxID=62062 RepID=A0A4W5QYU0_9TELE
YSVCGVLNSLSLCLSLSLSLSLCRKEQSVLSPVNCWNLLLSQVKRESRDHATLSDLYLNNIIPRFAQVSEDSGRLFKKLIQRGLWQMLKVFHEGLRILRWREKHSSVLLLTIYTLLNHSTTYRLPDHRGERTEESRRGRYFSQMRISPCLSASPSPLALYLGCCYDS